MVENTNPFRIGHSTATRLVALFTGLVFSITSSAWAQPVVPLPSGIIRSAAFSSISDGIKIPEELGSIQVQSKVSDDAPFILLIQDAHAILDAQTNIQKLIDFLQTQYGVNLVALEGGKGALDPTLFRTFPEELVKKQVLGQYLDRGELSGAEMAAIFNPTEARYYGIEDWNLYEENYLAYLRAMEVKEKLLEKLKVLKSQFDGEREKIYSPNLNEFHKHVEAFYEESSHLIELLKYLQSFQASGETLREKYPHLATLFESLARDSSMDKEGLETHIRRMGESFRKKFFTKLPLDKQKEFNRQYQALVTGTIDSGSFLKVLVDTAHSLGIRPKLSPVLQALLGHVETLSTIKGTKLFDELQSFVQKIEARLTVQPEERELAERYKKLRLLKDLSNLESTREELEQYRANPESYTSLLGEGDKFLLPSLEFYRVALERDQAFHKNLEGLLKKTKSHSVIVLAGGFHTQGFEQSLKDRGFSYAVISPKIGSLEGKEHYSEVMQGNLSYKKYLETTFYDAFTRHATLNLVSELNQPNFRKDLKLWRDEVIRKLANEGRITEASQYTRYIDLLFKVYFDKWSEENGPAASKEAILKAIEKETHSFRDETVSRLWQRFQIQFKEFTQGLRELVDKQALTKENVSSLLERANQTKPFTLVQLARPALTPGISVQSMRSELREFFLNGKQPEVTSETTPVPFANPQDVVSAFLEKARTEPVPPLGVVDALSRTESVRTVAQGIIETGGLVERVAPEAKPTPVNPQAVNQMVTSVERKARGELQDLPNSVTPGAVALAIAKSVNEQSEQIKQAKLGALEVTAGPIDALNLEGKGQTEQTRSELRAGSIQKILPWAMAGFLFPPILISGLDSFQSAQQAQAQSSKAESKSPDRNPELLKLVKSADQLIDAGLELLAKDNKRALQNFKQAETDLRKALAAVPKDYFHPEVGKWWQRLGDAVYDQAVAQYGNDFTHAEWKKANQRLVEINENAIKNDSYNLRHHDNLRSAYVRLALGNKADPLPYFTDAARKDPQNPLRWYHVANAYYQIDENKKALESLQQAFTTLEKAPKIAAAQKKTLQKAFNNLKDDIEIQQLGPVTLDQLEKMKKWIASNAEREKTIAGVAIIPPGASGRLYDFKKTMEGQALEKSIKHDAEHFYESMGFDANSKFLVLALRKVELPDSKGVVYEIYFRLNSDGIQEIRKGLRQTLETNAGKLKLEKTKINDWIDKPTVQIQGKSRTFDLNDSDNKLYGFLWQGDKHPHSTSLLVTLKDGSSWQIYMDPDKSIKILPVADPARIDPAALAKPITSDKAVEVRPSDAAFKPLQFGILRLANGLRSEVRSSKFSLTQEIILKQGESVIFDNPGLFQIRMLRATTPMRVITNDPGILLILSEGNLYHYNPLFEQPSGQPLKGLSGVIYRMEQLPDGKIKISNNGPDHTDTVSVRPVRAEVRVDIAGRIIKFQSDADQTITIQDRNSTTGTVIRSTPRRAEVRETPQPQFVDLHSLLPNATQVIEKIQEKGGLEVAIKTWEDEARSHLENDIREKLTDSVDRIISEGANKFQKIEDFMGWLFSPDFEKEIQNSLQSLIHDRTIEPIDAQALVWRIRGAVTGEAALAVEKVDLELAQQVAGVDEGKISAFQDRLEQAVTALKTTYQGQKLTIAINYPDSEIVREVLNKFSDLIDRLEILLEKSQGLRRSDWQGFHLSTETVDPQNPGRAVTNVNKRGFGQEVSYALTNNLLPTDLIKNLNAIRAEIRKIPDQRIQKMAYEASVLLLFKLAELPKARRSELRKAETFKSFLEQDQNLRFLANGFGIGQDGTVGLITSGFLADIAGIEQVKRAA